jgi:hypothetical protein
MRSPRIFCFRGANIFVAADLDGFVMLNRIRLLSKPEFSPLSPVENCVAISKCDSDDDFWRFPGNGEVAARNAVGWQVRI